MNAQSFSIPLDCTIYGFVKHLCFFLKGKENLGQQIDAFFGHLTWQPKQNQN